MEIYKLPEFDDLFVPKIPSTPRFPEKKWKVISFVAITAVVCLGIYAATLKKENEELLN